MQEPFKEPEILRLDTRESNCRANSLTFEKPDRQTNYYRDKSME